MTTRRPTPEELRAWKRVARSVTPLAGKSENAPKTGCAPKSATEPVRDNRTRTRTGPAPGKTPPHDPAASHTPGPANRARERRVRRGQVEIAARFDLHGHTQASAEMALPAFLQAQRQAGARCVLVITGKGGDGTGVLKRYFLHWLEGPAARPLVSGIAPAHARHGGGGAFYVFLRRPERA